MIGPAAGPLREVASCSGQGLPGPVSVSGSRVAWGDAGCAGTAPAITIAGADPAATPRRVPVTGVPGSIVLGQEDGGLVALVRDGAASEIRSFGASTLRVGVALGSRRSARVKLRLHVANAYGVADSATIAVRR